MILDFIRNKIVEVEPLSDGSMNVFWRVKDSLLEAEVELQPRPPWADVGRSRVMALALMAAWPVIWSGAGSFGTRTSGTRRPGTRLRYAQRSTTRSENGRVECRANPAVDCLF